jgi:uncharacterized protein (TIGR00266 family)
LFLQTQIEGAPSFAYLHIDLAPGESVNAESDAMASMDSNLSVEAKFNGGFFSAILKRLFGGESLFVGVYSNNSDQSRRVTLAQASPGDIQELALNRNSMVLQPGAYVASTPGVKLSLEWAGFRSWIAREGLFKLRVSGEGIVWFGAFGGVLFRDVRGSYIVDSSHLVAYDPHLKLKIQLAGGIFSSFFGGEGIVTRMEGDGKIAIQTRSLHGFSSWINPML